MHDTDQMGGLALSLMACRPGIDEGCQLEDTQRSKNAFYDYLQPIEILFYYNRYRYDPNFVSGDSEMVLRNDSYVVNQQIDHTLPTFINSHIDIIEVVSSSQEFHELTA